MSEHSSPSAPASSIGSPASAAVTTTTRMASAIRSIDVYRLTGIALAVLIWQLGSMAIGAAVLPDPLTTVSYIADNFLASEYLLVHRLPGGEGGWLPQLAYSVQNVVVGVSIGTVLGVSIGLLSVRLPVIAEVAAPVTGTFGAAPIVIAVPFFLIWFGIVPAAQVIILAFYTTILLFVYSRRAAQNVRADFIEYAATLGSSSWMTFRRVLLPASVPEVLAGLRIALAGAWGLEAIAELLGAQGGAGFLMKFYSGTFILEGMLGLTLLLGVIAVACDFIVVRVAGYFTRWSESGHQLQL